MLPATRYRTTRAFWEEGPHFNLVTHSGSSLLLALDGCSLSPDYALQDLARQTDTIRDRGVDPRRWRADIIARQPNGRDDRGGNHDCARKAVLTPSFLLFASDRPLHLAQFSPPARWTSVEVSCEEVSQPAERDAGALEH